MGIGNLHAAKRAQKNRRSNPFLYPDISPVHWEEQANCKGKAFELFEYQEKDSPLAKDLKFKERLAFNYANFELAGEICIECPVMLQCRESADDLDKYWTVRGGEPPGRFYEEKKHYESLGRPMGYKTPEGDRVCQRGHLVPGGGRCKKCKIANNVAAQRERRRSAKSCKVDTTEKPTG